MAAAEPRAAVLRTERREMRVDDIQFLPELRQYCSGVGPRILRPFGKATKIVVARRSVHFALQHALIFASNRTEAETAIATCVRRSGLFYNPLRHSRAIMKPRSVYYRSRRATVRLSPKRRHFSDQSALHPAVARRQCRGGCRSNSAGERDCRHYRARAR